MNKILLDSSRRLYKEKFKEISDKLLDIILIKNIIENLKRSRPIKYEIEQVNKNIAYLLNKIIHKIEGQIKGIPYSKKKVRRAVILRY